MYVYIYCVHTHIHTYTLADHLVGLVVKASTLRSEAPGFKSHMRQDFYWSSHTGDFKFCTPVATLPGTGHYVVSTVTGWPGVSML